MTSAWKPTLQVSGHAGLFLAVNCGSNGSMPMSIVGAVFLSLSGGKSPGQGRPSLRICTGGKTA
jgi:hypothetical protein